MVYVEGFLGIYFYIIFGFFFFWIFDFNGGGFFCLFDNGWFFGGGVKKKKVLRSINYMVFYICLLFKFCGEMSLIIL